MRKMPRFRESTRCFSKVSSCLLGQLIVDPIGVPHAVGISHRRDVVVAGNWDVLTSLSLVIVVASMPPHGREVSYELRCCIVCLRVFLPPPSNSFGRISRMLQLEERTCVRIWLRAEQRAEQRAQQRAGSNDLRELLAYVSNLGREGRLPTIVDGT